MQNLDLDVLIFGGGIAGLWSLARLRQAGYAAILVDTHRLGGVQTLSSQGIIHGGIKYALSGQLTSAATAISAMPARWRACLAATGELDLSDVKILAQHQCLWTTDNVGSTLAGLFASHAIRSRVEVINDPTQYPQVLQHSQFNGQVYRLDEPVLNVKSLITELARYCDHACLWIDAIHLDIVEPLTLILSLNNDNKMRVRPNRIVLAAGIGNEALLSQFGKSTPAMQRRPLHMLMARGPLPPLYAHCLGVSSNPRVTITSYPTENGDWVWYLGGQLAETGVNRSPSQQIIAGQQELNALFPWWEFKNLQWSTLRVERAEPRMPAWLRPDRYFLETHHNISVMWPTKLAFAPALATGLLESLAAEKIRPQGHVEVLDWPKPLIPLLPWELSYFL